jgi:aspartokinase/homoserine dehydrogenase 1
MDDDGIPPGEALERLAAAGRRVRLDDLVAAAARDPDGVFVDCTASPVVADRCADLLAAGTAVVSANKLGPAGTLDHWRALRRVPTRFRFETTVGAALPLVSVIEDLVATGDEVRGIDGVLSGTLAYVLDQVANGRRFSEAMRDAHDRGYTEPDPREDLAGRDVGRKILILARLAGRDFELADVAIEPVLPVEGWGELTLDDFWSQLPVMDDVFARRQAEATRRRERLAYLARLEGTGARVRLESVPASHPAASLRGTDNLVALTTRRYQPAPLVVRGPGAGPELTASGVFADLLRAVAQR